MAPTTKKGQIFRGVRRREADDDDYDSKAGADFSRGTKKRQTATTAKTTARTGATTTTATTIVATTVSTTAAATVTKTVATTKKGQISRDY